MGNIFSYFNTDFYNLNSFFYVNQYIQYFKKKHPYVIQVYYNLNDKKCDTIIKLDKTIINLSKGESINGKLVKFEHVFDKQIQISQHTYYFNEYNEIENFIMKIKKNGDIKFSFLKNQDNKFIYINDDDNINDDISDEVISLGKMEIIDFDLVYAITVKN
jgi:hypothetical protein